MKKRTDPDLMMPKLNRKVWNGPGMDIYAKHGARVVFHGASPLQVRWGASKDPNPMLQLGGTYIVDYTEVHSFYTKVRLVGIDEMFPCVAFHNVGEKDCWEKGESMTGEFKREDLVALPSTPDQNDPCDNCVFYCDGCTQTEKDRTMFPCLRDEREDGQGVYWVQAKKEPSTYCEGSGHARPGYVGGVPPAPESSDKYWGVPEHKFVGRGRCSSGATKLEDRLAEFRMEMNKTITAAFLSILEELRVAEPAAMDKLIAYHAQVRRDPCYHSNIPLVPVAGGKSGVNLLGVLNGIHSRLVQATIVPKYDDDGELTGFRERQ